MRKTATSLVWVAIIYPREIEPLDEHGGHERLEWWGRYSGGGGKRAGG
ncbi:hypothetical protein [Teichococcus deserti]|nr:hypothetical protein [Pseudoroseomonas deserti]